MSIYLNTDEKSTPLITFAFKPPMMSDLKESSSLEQDGDYIFLLHRPYTENKADYAPTHTKLIVEKNKFGSTGIIDLYFDGSHQEFKEVTNNY